MQQNLKKLIIILLIFTIIYLFGILQPTSAQTACIDGTKPFACNIDGSQYCYNGTLVSQCKDCSFSSFNLLKSNQCQKECSLCPQISQNVRIFENQEILDMPQVYIKGMSIDIKAMVSRSDQIIKRVANLRNNQDHIVSTTILTKDPLDEFLFDGRIDTNLIDAGQYKLDIFLESVDGQNQTFMNIKTIFITEAACNKLKSSEELAGKINIVFIPAGFSQTDFDNNIFQNKTQKLIDDFLSVDPFSEYKNAFNFYYINSDVLKCRLSEVKDNLCKKTEVLQLSQACGGLNNFIVVYGSVYTEASGQIIYMSGLDHGKILAHEFAHAFGGLNDEYFRGSNVKDATLINCDHVGCPKWCSSYENIDRFKNTPCEENACDVRKGCFDNTDPAFKIEEIPDACFNHFVFCTRIQNKEECNKWADGRLCAYIDDTDQYAQSTVKYYGSRCVPNTAKYTNIGLVCEDGGGCYQGCSSATTFRQTASSIMGSDQAAEGGAVFSPYARKYLISLLSKFNNHMNKIEGDLNNDNKVDIFDLVTVARDFGKKDDGFAGDADRDGDVDIFDLVIVAKNFGKKVE